MSCKSIELADAIAALLNREPEEDEEEFILRFEAQRRTAPLTETELQEAKEVQVLVFTGSRKSERVTRCESSKSYQPIIGIQRPINLETMEANETLVDQLQELVEQIETRIDGVDLADLSFVGFDDDQYAEVYNSEALRDLSFFAAAIQLEYTSG